MRGEFSSSFLRLNKSGVEIGEWCARLKYYD